LGTAVKFADIYADNLENKWQRLDRTIFLFDTSSLPESCTVTNAVLSLYGMSKYKDGDFAVVPEVVSSNPTSNTELAAGDFDSLGSTPFSDTIAYTAFDTTDYNDYTLNASGIAAISKTGISKFGMRDKAYDRYGNTPIWAANKQCYVRGYCAEQGAGYKPKLVVTYTEPSLEINVNDSVSTTDVVSKALLVSLVSVFSAISPINAVTVEESLLNVNVNNTITLAENVNASVYVPPLEVNVNEEITVNIPTRGLVGHWTLAEDNYSEGVFQDLSENNNDGTPANEPVFTTNQQGIDNGAMVFNGVDDYVNVPNSDSLNITNQLTIGLWVNLQYMDTFQVLVEKAWANGYAILVSLQRDIRCYYSGGGSPTYYWLSSGIHSFNWSEWVHIAYTFTTSLAKIYVNGVLKNSKAPEGNITQQPSYPLMIGRASGGNYPAKGLIDNIRIYNRALTEDEIEFIYREEYVELLAQMDDMVVSTNDSVTLTENTSLVMDDMVTSVYDVIGITESIVTALVSLINISDTVSIAEDIDLYIFQTIDVSDSVTLTESVSSVMDDMEISLDDDITIEEWSPVNCPQEINVYDSVSIVSESVEISIAWPISVYDSITLAESITTVLPDALAIDINDAVGVAEDVTVSIYDFTISVNDAVTLAEDVSLLQISYISAGDDITLTEDVSSVMTDMAVDVNDAVSTAESVSLEMSDSEIGVSESITITENTNEVLVSFIDTDDTITLAESIEVVPDDLTVNLNDNVILAENITVSIYDFSIDVNDIVSVNEYTTLAIGNLVPSVYDTIMLAEDVSLTMSDIDVGVNDSITLSELISTALAYTINVNDTVSVIENVDVDLLISIDESDTITLAENVGINIPITIFIDEDIALAESIDTGISDFEINVNNTITINELAISDLQVSINTNDSIAITEDVDIDASRVLSVYESISIAENVSISGVIQGDIDVLFSISQPDVSFSTIQPDVVFSVSQPDVKFERG